jgi:hypothetical protein
MDVGRRSAGPVVVVERRSRLAGHELRSGRPEQHGEQDQEREQDGHATGDVPGEQMHRKGQHKAPPKPARETAGTMGPAHRSSTKKPAKASRMRFHAALEILIGVGFRTARLRSRRCSGVMCSRGTLPCSIEDSTQEVVLCRARRPQAYGHLEKYPKAVPNGHQALENAWRGFGMDEFFEVPLPFAPVLFSMKPNIAPIA